MLLVLLLGMVRGAAVAVCQDEHGHYMGSSSITFSGITDPPTLEALACREALALANDLQIPRILVSSDCATVIKDIKANNGGQYGAIIKEISAWSREFEACNFIHESRARNFEADNLAKISLSLDLGRHVWFLQPDDIVTIPMNFFG